MKDFFQLVIGYVIKLASTFFKSIVHVAVYGFLAIVALIILNATGYLSAVVDILFYLILIAIFLGLVYISFSSILRKTGKKSSQDNLILSVKKGSVAIQEPNRGVLVAGGAGSGKTESILIPILGEGVKKNFGLLVYDFKFPTLANVVSSFVVQYGNKLKLNCVTFDYPEYSNRINPISPRLIKTSNDVRTIVKALMYRGSEKEGDFWQSTSENILTAAIVYFSRKQKNICTLPHVFSLLLHTDKKKVIEKISEEPECKLIIAPAASLLDNEKTLGDVFATLQNFISVFVNEKIFWVLSGDEIDPVVNDSINPSILIFGNSPMQARVNGPLLSLLMTLTLNRMNERDRHKSLVVLDEAPTIYIPDFEQIPATARSNKIATVYGVQDISQIETMYGKERTEGILSNLSTQFYGRTLNTRTGERISKLFGKYEKKTVSVTKTGRGNLFGVDEKSFTESVHDANVYEADVLSLLKTGEFVGLLSTGEKSQEMFNTNNPHIFQALPAREISADFLQDNFSQIMQEASEIFK